MSVIVIDSLPRAITMLCNRMRDAVSLEIFDESSNTGYYLRIQRNLTPTEEMSIKDLQRAVRRHKNPQPYDIKIEEWEAWRYRGYHRGEQSSAL